MKNDLEGTWELLSGQPLPGGARDTKMILGGHFMFAAYDGESGKSLYAAGGTYHLDGDSYVEHMEFATDKLSNLVGQDHAFTIEVKDNILVQSGKLSDGTPLKETFRRIG